MNECKRKKNNKSTENRKHCDTAYCPHWSLKIQNQWRKNCHKWRKIYIFLVQECSLLQVYLSLSMNLQTSLASQLRSKTGEGDCLQWGWQGKKMILFQTVFNTMLTLDALRRDWRIERKLHNYIEEPSQWRGYNMYMAPLTLSSFQDAGKGKNTAFV